MRNGFKNMMSAVLALVVAAGATSPLTAGEKLAREVVAAPAHALAHAGDRAKIEARVKAAAMRVCSSGGVDMKNYQEKRQYKACLAEAGKQSEVRIASILDRSQMAQTTNAVEPVRMSAE